jgi:hypothetical protein
MAHQAVLSCCLQRETELDLTPAKDHQDLCESAFFSLATAV